MRVILNILMVLALGLAATGASADGDIQVRDPWVQAAPPNVKVLAAYLEIVNNGKNPQVLTGVSCPAFDHVGIHRSMMHGNMVHMEQIKELTIPPQASVALKPGELHLMLTDAKKPLKAGDQVPMTLTFQNGKKIALTAIVRSGQTGVTDDHQHMDHSGHDNHKP